MNAALFNRMQFSLAFNYLNVLMHSTDRTQYPQPAFVYSVGANMKLSLVDWYLPMGTGVIYLLCRVSNGRKGVQATSPDYELVKFPIGHPTPPTLYILRNPPRFSSDLACIADQHV